MIVVRLAISADARFLPEIERSSGEAFRQIPELAWIADDTVLPVESHLELIDGGAAWVAEDDGQEIVGFLSGEVFAQVLHIWQMAVRADRQRAGAGRALLAATETWARDSGLAALSLTTFRDVPWNEAFYRSCGFERLEHGISPMLLRTLAAEKLAGLPIERRCAMIKRLV